MEASITPQSENVSAAESARQMPKTPPPSTSSSRTLGADPELGRRLKLMADYASALRERATLEEAMAILKYTNADLLGRLKLVQAELERAKLALHANDDEIARLRQTTDAAVANLARERKMCAKREEKHDAAVGDLRAIVRTLQRQLSLATADGDKSRRSLARYKTRCAEYKTKLRGFAILFTYFNDPSRRTSESSLSAEESRAIPSKMNASGVIEHNVTRDFRML